MADWRYKIDISKEVVTANLIGKKQDYLDLTNKLITELTEINKKESSEELEDIILDFQMARDQYSKGDLGKEEFECWFNDILVSMYNWADEGHRLWVNIFI